MADETTTNRKIGIIEANSDKLTNLANFMDGNKNLKSVDCNFQYVTNTMYAFRGCSALTSFKGKYPSVTKAEGMFNSSGLTDIQIGSDKDVSLGSVTNILNIFENCEALKSANISLDDVTHAENAFNGCKIINNVTVNLPSVKYIDGMFKGCSTLSTIAVNFDSATGASNLFDGCSNLSTATVSLQSLNSISSSTFNGCNNLLTLTINAPNANGEFTLPNSITTLNGNLNKLTSFALPTSVETSTVNLASVTDGEKLVKNANNLKTVSGDWSKITTFGEKHVPYTLESFNVDISSLVNGNNMFSGCGSLNEVSFINGLPNLTTANRMFGDTISLKRIEVNFPKLGNATRMFGGSDLGYVKCNFGDASNEESKVLVDGTLMFENCTELILEFYTNLSSTLQIGDSAFDGATNLTTLYTNPSSGEANEIDGFAELKSAQNMFRGTSIKNLGKKDGNVVSMFNLPELRNAKGMFSRDTFASGKNFMKYTHLDVPKLMCADEMFKNSNIYYFGTASTEASTLISGHSTPYYITTALNMFDGCKELWAVHLDALDISDLVVGNGMFSNCESLAYFCSHLTSLKAGVNMFHGCKLNKDSLDYISDTIHNIYSLFDWNDDGTRGNCKDENEWTYSTWAKDITTGTGSDVHAAMMTIDAADRGMIHVDVDKEKISQAEFDSFSKKLADKGWKVESCSYKTEFSYDISHANHQYSSNISKWKTERYEAFNLNITSIGWDEEKQQGVMYGTIGDQEGNEPTN